MPTTIGQARENAAALVIQSHLPTRGTCACGVEWTALHVAESLSRAGALGPTRIPTAGLVSFEQARRDLDG